MLPAVPWLLLLVQLYLTGLLFAAAISVRCDSKNFFTGWGWAFIWPYTLLKFICNRKKDA